MDLDTVDGKLAEGGQYQLNTDNQRQLLPTRETISGVWPEPPPANRLHIVVGLPRGVIPSISSVWFFFSFLLVLGLSSNTLPLFSPGWHLV